MDSSVLVSGHNTSTLPGHYSGQNGGGHGRNYGPNSHTGNNPRRSSTSSSAYSNEQHSSMMAPNHNISISGSNFSPAGSNTNSLTYPDQSQQEQLHNQFSAMALAAAGANAIRIKAAYNGNVYISSIEYNYSLEELVDHIQSICGIKPNPATSSASSSSSAPSHTSNNAGRPNDTSLHMRNSFFCK